MKNETSSPLVVGSFTEGKTLEQLKAMLHLRHMRLDRLNSDILELRSAITIAELPLSNMELWKARFFNKGKNSDSNVCPYSPDSLAGEQWLKGHMSVSWLPPAISPEDLAF